MRVMRVAVLAAVVATVVSAAVHRDDPPPPITVPPNMPDIVVTVNVSTTAATTPFPHFWKRCVGSGHALLALRADWQAQLKDAHNDLGFERVRFHGIFDDDLSTVLDTPDGYQFYNIDRIYQPILDAGMRPIVELSFMPGLLARCAPFVRGGPPCETVMHYRGVVMPPANFSEWEALVGAFGQHLVDRFGAEEVRQWHFEVWNENWGMPFPQPYLELYDTARRALKSVDAQLQVGGPVTEQCKYLEAFSSARRDELDFVSSHLYPTDPNCTDPSSPLYDDPDCFSHTLRRARSQVPAEVPFFLTEYNAGLGDTWLLYSSYAAAFLFRNVGKLYDVLDIWSYWTFTDIFEESGMHSAPFEGFNYGIQTNRGVKKAVYRAFQLLRDAGSNLYQTAVFNTSSLKSDGTVDAFATAPDSTWNDNTALRAFVSNFVPHDTRFSIKNHSVRVQWVGDSTTTCSYTHVNASVNVVDANNANAHAAWEAIGSPRYPTDGQLAQMRAASEVIPTQLPIRDGGDGYCFVDLEVAAYAAIRVDIPSV